MFSSKIWNGGTTTKRSRIPWQTSVMSFYFILALMKITSCEILPSVRVFFPSIKNDLTKVTWANDVGTVNGINVAKRVKKMMISGEVELHVWTGSVIVPWMKHDNDDSTSITLQDLLYRVSNVKSIGVRLNFDSTYVLKKAIIVLEAMRKKLTFPLWLNGITIYMNDTDVDEFLSLCTHNFPEATISIGFDWKGYKAPAKPKKYDAELITEMKDTLTRNNVTQTVAFPVEIRRAALSLDTLPALKDVPGITDSALYIYGGLTGSDDYLDVVSKIKSLINNFGRNRVYLNLNPILVENLI